MTGYVTWHGVPTSELHMTCWSAVQRISKLFSGGIKEERKESLQSSNKLVRMKVLGLFGGRVGISQGPWWLFLVYQRTQITALKSLEYF